jgi:tight adherence protein B
MAFMVAAVVFFAMVLIFVTVWVATSAKSTQEIVRGRIEELQAAEAWNGISTNLKLVRDELYSTVPVLHNLLAQSRFATWVQKFISQAGLKTKPAKLLLSSVVAGVVTYFLLGFIFPFFISIPMGIAIALIPLANVAWKRRKRFGQFEERFPDALDMFARAVRAGHSFTSAMELVVKESPEPIAGEFSIVYDEQNFGMPLRDSLIHLTDRVPLIDVRFFVTTLNVQKDSGGNLAEVLDQLSRVIRERFRIQRDVKVKTALGRMTAGILMSLPIAMLVMLSFVNPDYETVLFHDPMGPLVLGAAAGLQVVGAFILWRIVKIEV